MSGASSSYTCHLSARSASSTFEANWSGRCITTAAITDGAEWWDLRTEEQQDVAFGVYVFHVEAPGIGEHVGKFALVK